jgi:PAS domain S-box-containing protein
MLSHQLLEARTVALGGAASAGVSEIVETSANTLASVAIYYGTTVFERERDLSQRLRESENRYRTLTEGSPVPILVCTDEEIRYVNESAAELLGTDSPDAVIGESVHRIAPPDEESRVLERVTEMVRDDDLTVVEERIVGFDDRDRDVLISGGRAEYDGEPAVYLVFRDVTREREFRRKYERSQSRLRATLESSNDAMLLIDPENEEIVDANSQAEDLLKYDRGTLVGLTPYAIHPHEKARFGAFLGDVFEENGVITNDLSCLRQDGVEVPVEVSASPVDVQGRQCVLAMIRDITERERQRQQVAVLSRILRHNLRNDMSVVVGQAEFVEAETVDERVAGAARKIQEKSADLVHLSQRVRDLQSLIRNDTDHSEEVDVAQVVDGVVAEVRTGYPDVEFEVDVPPAATARATEQSLAWALTNLVENAAEHNDAERPHVSVAVESVSDRRGEWLTLSVADNGPGIPEVEHTAAIRPDEQTDLSHSTGLGLWIVGQVADAFDGSVTFGDRDGDGNVVSITLRGTVDADTTVA